MSKIKRIAIFSIILLFSIIILLFPLEAKEKANTSPMLTSTLTLTLGEKQLDIDGKLHTIEIASYCDTHSEVMMPLRVIAESFGFDVKWISSEQKILIKDGYKEIILFIDSNKVLVNNQQFELDYTPCLLPPGRTFVSLQFINEILGAKVV
ncbi:MAG: copper amine oxidase N-terminal domain-containing protein [Clostridia bacterium]|nr:copper amine oxidase N-terminal domain-containing protein [Clostridia bacterium]